MMHECIRRLGRHLSSCPSSMNDDTKELIDLCHLLERALNHKMVREASLFEVVQNLNKEQPREEGLNALLAPILSELSSASRLIDSVGRSRQLLRILLNSGWLNSLVMSLRTWKNVYQWYSIDSLIRCEPNQGLMHILPILERIRFELDLTNTSFLNLTFERATLKHVRVVPPFKDLGLMISCVENQHTIVTRVKPYSQASIQAKIGLGDILERLDGHDLFGMHPDQVGSFVKKCSKEQRVLNITVLTCQSPIFYEPMVTLWNRIGLDLGDIALRSREFDPLNFSDDEEVQQNVERNVEQEDNNGDFELIYLGSLAVGNVGNASRLDSAIARVLNQSQLEHRVHLVVHELGIKIFDEHDNKLVLHATYPEISSCGCSTRDQRFLAFLAGNDLCTMATDFLCHVFRASDERQARLVISNIAEGFQRTRNTV